MVQLTERLGVALGEARERSAGLVQVFVDYHAGAVAERRALLHRRLDIGEAEAMQLQVAEQR